MDLQANFITIARSEAFVVIALAGSVLFRRLKRSILLTATGGFHSNVLIFMGVGPWIFTLDPDVPERVPYVDLLQALRWPYAMFVVGYALWCVIERFFLIGTASSWRPHGGMRFIRLDILLSVACFATIGYLTADLDFAKSGVGTIIPVLRGFFYPVVLASLLRLRKNDYRSMIVALIMSLGSAAFAVLSAWRSQLIILASCVALTLALRFRRGGFYSLPVMAVILYVILPFQLLKRTNYEIFEGNLGLFVRATFEMPWQERNTSVIDFVGLRINTAREMAYVQAAVDSGSLETRMGKGYWEAAQQLVPRFMWPTKPTFNFLSGFTLPRDIGLLDPDDPDTSWGVGIWAEFIWNFPYLALVVFVPLSFALASLIDWLISRWLSQFTVQWLAFGVFYFLFLQAVSAVMLLPHIMWTTIFLATLDRCMKSLSPERRIMRTTTT